MCISLPFYVIFMTKLSAIASIAMFASELKCVQFSFYVIISIKAVIIAELLLSCMLH